MALQESGEMYLETIYVLSQKTSSVRGIDIAEHLGYSKPSVSRAMGLLKDEGLVKKDSEGYYKLTEAGEILAKRIYERHTVLTKMFINLGVDEETAAEAPEEAEAADALFKAAYGTTTVEPAKPVTVKPVKPVTVELVEPSFEPAKKATTVKRKTAKRK